MKNKRLIARMDIKGPNLIKGIQLEGLRVVGDPREAAIEYYKSGIDEIIFIDAVASLFKRNNLVEIVKRVSNDVFIPLSVGGGIRSVEDVKTLLHSGADKVAVNTAAHSDPQLLRQIANTFGSQCLVLSVEAKKKKVVDGKLIPITVENIPGKMLLNG
nr:HisA/HisF-related TIM barrel protein [Desulfocapsa sulfexigens]